MRIKVELASQYVEMGFSHVTFFLLWMPFCEVFTIQTLDYFSFEFLIAIGSVLGTLHCGTMITSKVNERFLSMLYSCEHFVVNR